MKVAYNSRYGGFGLSHKAVMRYAEIKGIKLYPFVSKNAYDFNSVYRPYIVGEKVPLDLIHYSTKPLTDEGHYEKDSYFFSGEIARDDLALIQVIEELGDEANGTFADLVIAEIPDGIEYEISEYDGNETVEEKHRSWR